LQFVGHLFLGTGLFARRLGQFREKNCASPYDEVPVLWRYTPQCPASGKR
jgi:hypothetical protein